MYDFLGLLYCFIVLLCIFVVSSPYVIFSYFYAEPELTWLADYCVGWVNLPVCMKAITHPTTNRACCISVMGLDYFVRLSRIEYLPAP